jgi:hypothetical protein
MALWVVGLIQYGIDRFMAYNVDETKCLNSLLIHLCLVLYRYRDEATYVVEVGFHYSVDCMLSQIRRP